MKLKIEDILKQGAELKPRKLTNEEIQEAKSKNRFPKLPKSVRFPYWV